MEPVLNSLHHPYFRGYRYFRTHTQLREKRMYSHVVEALFTKSAVACVTFAEVITADASVFKAFTLSCPERSVRSDFVKILLVVLMAAAQHRILEEPAITKLLELVVECIAGALQHSETSEEFIELVGDLCQTKPGVDGESVIQIIGSLVQLGGVDAMLKVLGPALLGDEAHMYVVVVVC
jgi:hypothetical protein